MDTYEQRARDLLSRRLNQPHGHLLALEHLSADDRQALRAAIERAVGQRRRLLDRALGRVLPGPLRTLLLRGLLR